MVRSISVVINGMILMCVLIQGVNASFISQSCSMNNATLTSIEQIVAPPLPQGEPSGINLLSTTYHATSCAGFLGNDDAGGLSNPSPNIGQRDDGLLNGEDGFDPNLFVDSSEFQALDLDGIKNDPGWIHLAAFDADSSGESNGGISYSTSGPAPLSSDPELVLDIEDLLTLTLTCTSGDLDDCSSIDWLITTKLGIIDDVQALLGPSTFDHLAFSVKAGSGKAQGNGNGGGNDTGGFIIYDFNFKDIFADEDNPALNFLTPYQLGGTLSTADLGDKGISHLNVWARDPLDTTSVPEPESLLLLAFTLLWMHYRYMRQ